MQWLNENDDVSLEFLRNAYAKDKKDNVSISKGNEAHKGLYNKAYTITIMQVTLMHLYFFLTIVSKEYRACQLFELSCWCVHTADSMFRSPSETWMPRPWDLEEIYEEICKNSCKSSHRIF